MGIRETLNENPQIATGITIGIILLAIIVIVWQMRGPSVPVLTHRYYSVDDGQTYFAADARLVPPFEHDGQEAVLAYVFRCGGGEPFVGYLETYTPEMKEHLEAEMRGEEWSIFWDVEEQEANTLVKRPGDEQWVILADERRSDEITTVRCPDGTRDGLERVFPR